MAKILLLGNNPPVFTKQTKLDASNYRTWQFLQPLIEDGHQLCFCPQKAEPDVVLEIPGEWKERLVYKPIAYNHGRWRAGLQEAHDHFQPDCIVAVNFNICLYATSLRTEKPIWMDIYGDYLTIVQAACYRAGSDRGIGTSISFVKDVLQKGDVFSTCGNPQSHAMVGELAMAGRLNSLTFGYQFVKTILPGAAPNFMENENAEELNDPLVGKTQPDDFLVVWSGGYNTWTDVDTLFQGLEWAFGQNPKIKFVSVGANTYTATDNVYTKFLGMIQRSAFSDRFILLGWRKWDEIPKVLKQCQAGLSIDAINYETIYGTRTRLLEMMALGMPVVTSLGTELSFILRNRGAALTFEIGDWQGLGSAILELSSNPRLCEDMRKTTLELAAKDFSFKTTTEPLIEWVRNPSLAPDKAGSNSLNIRKYEFLARSRIRRLLWMLFGKA